MTENAAALVQAKIYALFMNIWFLRTLIIITGIVLSSLLLAYSLIFLNTYSTLGSTTSYFPWSWDVSYTNLDSIQSMFNEAVDISMITLIGCAIGLVVCVPRFLVSVWKR